MTAPKDYHLLARAVACPTCYATVGARCHGARPGTRTKCTHVTRRARAAEARKEALQASKAGP